MFASETYLIMIYHHGHHVTNIVKWTMQEFQITACIAHFMFFGHPNEQQVQWEKVKLENNDKKNKNI